MGDMMDKVRRLRQLAPTLNIQVDGGLNEETVQVAVQILSHLKLQIN